MTDIPVTDAVKAMFEPLDEVERCEFLSACIDLFSVSDIWDCLSPDQQAELAALRSAQQWRGVESAPRDGTEFIALTKSGDGISFPNRRFVVRFVSGNDWALFPGYGVTDDYFVGWQPLPETGADQ